MKFVNHQRFLLKNLKNSSNSKSGTMTEPIFKVCYAIRIAYSYHWARQIAKLRPVWGSSITKLTPLCMHVLILTIFLTTLIDFCHWLPMLRSILKMKTRLYF